MRCVSLRFCLMLCFSMKRNKQQQQQKYLVYRFQSDHWPDLSVVRVMQSFDIWSILLRTVQWRFESKESMDSSSIATPTTESRQRRITFHNIFYIHTYQMKDTDLNDHLWMALMSNGIDFLFECEFSFQISIQTFIYVIFKANGKTFNGIIILSLFDPKYFRFGRCGPMSAGNRAIPENQQQHQHKHWNTP